MIQPNEKLQRARLEKRWSRAVASKRVGVSTNTFSRWEHGLQHPQLATLDMLCATFAMSAEELGFGLVVSPRGLAGNVEDEMQLNHEDERGGIPALIPSSQQSLYPHNSKSEQVEGELFSRRQVIAALIGTPAAVFGARQGDNLSLLRVEEILTLCAAHIPLCWEMYFEGGIAEVEPVLPDYITQLRTLVRHTSPSQKRAATLLSQAYQLASLLATQHQDYGAAATSAQQGLFYGELAGDPSLQAASCIRQALVCFYLKRARPRLQAYQKAWQLAPQTSPLIQGRIAVGLTEVLSKLGQEHEARHFLDLAQEHFPQHVEEDPNYAYTHFSNSSTGLFEGMMQLNLNQPDLAWTIFASIDHVTPADHVPARLELTVRQAAAACAMGEMELTCQYLETTVPMAYALNSQLRVDESYEIYERLLTQWGDEQPVKALEELFR